MSYAWQKWTQHVIHLENVVGLGLCLYGWSQHLSACQFRYGQKTSPDGKAYCAEPLRPVPHSGALHVSAISETTLYSIEDIFLPEAERLSNALHESREDHRHYRRN